MSLRYIIDAYNVINHPCFRPRHRKSAADQVLLADFIKSNKLCGNRKNTAVLVFDGYLPSGVKMPEEDSLVCVFSHKAEADEIIKRMVEKSAQPRNIVVVSDDKQVRACVRFLKARVSSVEDFILGEKTARDLDRKMREGEESKVSYSQMKLINEEFKQRWLK